MAYLAFLKFMPPSLAAQLENDALKCPLKMLPISELYGPFFTSLNEGSSRWTLSMSFNVSTPFSRCSNTYILTGALKPLLIIVEPFVFLLWAQSTFPTTPFAHWQSHPSLCPLAHNTTFIARVSTSYPSHIIHKSPSYSNCNKKKDRACSSASIINLYSIMKKHYWKNKNRTLVALLYFRTTL